MGRGKRRWKPRLDVPMFLEFFMPGLFEIATIAVILLMLASPIVEVVIVLGVVSRSQQGGGAIAHDAKLHPCRDCGQAVSLLASACPNCGRPLVE